MVFGTFDLLHDGHVHFLSEAGKYGGRLIVALAADNVVNLLKGRLPVNPFPARRKNLEKLKIASDVVAGDSMLGSWDVLESYDPDIIVLGYDQAELALKLKSFLDKRPKNIEIFYVGPYTDPKLHSSALRSKMLK